MSHAVTVVCTYRVKPDQTEAFQELLRKHWPTLRKHELVTDEPTRVYRGHEDAEAPTFYEVFSWRSEAASRSAHETPAVMAVWEPMGAMTEARDGRPAMEFHHMRPLEITFAEV